MIEKIKRKKQIAKQDITKPKTVDDLLKKYDLENADIYNYLDYVIDKLNEVEESTLTDLDEYFSQISVNRVIKRMNIVEINFRGQLGKNVSNDAPFLEMKYNAVTGYANTLYLGTTQYRITTPQWFYINSKQFKSNEMEAGKWVHISIVLFIDE